MVQIGLQVFGLLSTVEREQRCFTAELGWFSTSIAQPKATRRSADAALDKGIDGSC